MKAVILAAGKGVRMAPLTNEIPKPLVLVRGKPFIEHIIDALHEVVNEFIIVIGHKGEQIKNHLKKKYPHYSITYVEQEKPLGTADAFLKTKHLFSNNKERFFIIYGDAFTTQKEINLCLKHSHSWVCHSFNYSIPTGVVKIDKKGKIIKVAEKRGGSKPPFISAGSVMLVNDSIFKYKPWLHKKGEYYLTSMLGQFLKDNDVYSILGIPNVSLSTAEDIVKFNAL
ncbi:MAG: nucleotidyltransferase family protein [Patescibacteria group bacterium]|nr:nucleotidyltransferase family protein [Patescibacteria group bacterium]